MRVLIGTPIYDDQLLVPYHVSVMGLVAHFRRTRPAVSFDSSLIAATLVSKARNAMATLVLNDPSITHLLFIDADMGFSPALIEKMIDFDQPVTGAIYPARLNAYARIGEIARAVEGPQFRDVAQNYIGGSEVFQREDGRAVIRGEFVRVQHAGAGILLIKREALEQMQAAMPQLWSKRPGDGYPSWGVTGPVFQPFEALQKPDGFFMGEDVSFCRRWTHGCKGEIWSCFTETIRHVGRERYTGAYVHRMRHEGEI